MRPCEFANSFNKIIGEIDMGAIFTSPRNTVIAGVVLLIIIVLVIGGVTGQMTHLDMAWSTFAMRWLHVISGVLWIGLLWYLNFVQVPTMPTIPAELKPGVTKYIAPSALFYFRWGAAFTVLTGLLLAWSYDELVEALTLQPSQRLIGIGMWLALIMAFNVWVIIWPAQQKVLGLKPADDAAKASAAKRGLIASRTNVLLSIPMLLCMTNFH